MDNFCIIIKNVANFIGLKNSKTQKVKNSRYTFFSSININVVKDQWNDQRTIDRQLITIIK